MGSNILERFLGMRFCFNNGFWLRKLLYVWLKMFCLLDGLFLERKEMNNGMKNI